MTEEAKCPCCNNNPWARATADFFDQFCASCKEQNPVDKSSFEQETTVNDAGLSRANMDFSTSPSDNFYQFANGQWMANNPIPKEYPSWNTFMALRVKSQEQLRDICDSLLKNQEENKTDTETTEEEDKLRFFYSAAMDEDAVEKYGTKPLQPLLDLIETTVQSRSDPTLLAQNLGRFSWYGVEPFLHIHASPDYKNSSHSICHLAQGGIGLPDRDYYFDTDKAETREKYKTHVSTMLYLLDHSSEIDPLELTIPDEYRIMAEAVYALEEALAKAHMTKTENRDPYATYNKSSIHEIMSATCQGKLDVLSFLKSATNKTHVEQELGDVNVRNVQALQTAAEVISEVEEDTLRWYLKWHSVHSCAKYLSREFVQQDFLFYDQVLSGTQEMKPRWKLAMDFTEAALGEALGKLYCQHHFDESCKAKALEIVERVRSALQDRLTEVEWMTSTSTREQALTKMERFKVKIGFPDTWIDYSSMAIVPHAPLLSMVLASRAFHHQRSVNEMNAPTDRSKWFMTPQTVNAYYHPSLNEIVFPAAILQPPFFNPDADDAVNYGAMGAVVGHEMTHGFDDKGRKFNYEGNMVDWWTAADAEEYERRVDVMVRQANEFDVFGQKVQGKLTCGENIADLGGLRLAYRALTCCPGFEDAGVVNGFTPAQRFFLGWAQAWRQNITKERALQLVTLDPHGPAEMRCNGPLSNMAEFHSAFGVEPGAPMFKPVDERVDIW